jgi:hypothetical protein
MIELRELFLVITIVLLLIALVVSLYKKPEDRDYFKNDLSRDHQRWSEEEVQVAAYVVVFQSNKLRLNDKYQVMIESLLSRSPRSVQGKMRRIAAVGSEKSDASELTEDVVFAMASMSNIEARTLFLDNVKILEGSVDLFAPYVYEGQ